MRVVVVLLVCVSFMAALFLNPPYGFSPEDNLAYRDYIRIHLDAERFLGDALPRGSCAHRLPASDELSQTYLGYVDHPMRVVRVESFTIEEISAAAR